MFNGPMEWYRVKTTIPDFRVSWSIRIVWQLNIDESVFIILRSRALRREQEWVVSRNMLCQCVDIEVTMRSPSVSVVTDCLTKSNFLLLKYLIGQFLRRVIIAVNFHVVVLFHFFVVWNRRGKRDYWCISWAVWTMWGCPTSHIVVIIRILFFKDVHLCRVMRIYSW